MEVVEEILDTQAARIATLEEETSEGFSTTEESIDCVRFGLMEFGGFVRNTFLTRDQRSYMFTQERANLVLWNMKHRAETTDPQGEEEENPTNNPGGSAESHGSPGNIETLLENMRRDLNIALNSEQWTEANTIQGAITTLLDATAGSDPEGLSTRVVRDIRNVFQRLFRIHRNRGSDERMERYRTYVENMSSLMQ